MPIKRKPRDPLNSKNREWRVSLTEVETKKTLKIMAKRYIFNRSTVVAMGIALFNEKYGD